MSSLGRSASRDSSDSETTIESDASSTSRFSPTFLDSLVWTPLTEEELWQSEEEEEDVEELDPEDEKKYAFIQRLEANGPGAKNDISRLMELEQAGHIDRPDFGNGLQRGPGWEVTVNVYHYTGVRVQEVALGRSKKEAKAKCATQAYEKVRIRTCPSPASLT
jgi:hypothetical protein